MFLQRGTILRESKNERNKSPTRQSSYYTARTEMFKMLKF